MKNHIFIELAEGMRDPPTWGAGKPACLTFRDRGGGGWGGASVEVPSARGSFPGRPAGSPGLGGDFPKRKCSRASSVFLEKAQVVQEKPTFHANDKEL